MSLKEFKEWCVYRSKRGSLNFGRRIEQNIGLANYLITKGLGNKRSKIEDFTPHEIVIKESQDSDASQILSWLEHK